MSKTGRNDPCPCGSGKKYKRCCLNKENNVIDIQEKIIKRELEGLHGDLGKFFINLREQMAGELTAVLNDMDIELDPDFAKDYTLLFMLWLIFNEHTLDGKTPFQEFMQEYGDGLRPSVQEIVDEWNTVPGMYEVTDHIDEGHFIVEKFGTGEQSVVSYEEDDLPEIGNGIVGILVSFGEEESQFLLTFQEFALSQLQKVFATYKHLSSEQFDQVMQQRFPSVLLDIFTYVDDENEDPYEVIASREWLTDKHKRVAEHFCLMNENTSLTDLRSSAVKLWYNFCEEDAPRIGKETVFAATLEYVVHLLEGNEITQKEAAAKYGVSANSISQRFQDMEYFIFELVEDMAEDLDLPALPGTDQDKLTVPNTRMEAEWELFKLEKAMQGEHFQSEEDIRQFLNEYMNNPPLSKQSEPLSKREQARELLYDAWDMDPPDRIASAYDALELYPDSPDAYVILAEEADSLEEKNELYLKGVHAGEADLGAEFFKKNRGRFWGIIETRPYMRAKLGYAVTLAEMGEQDLANDQYREMLELNENDNQGIRYALLTSLLKTGAYQEAVQLMERYPDDPTAHIAYNRVYLDYAVNGWTNHTENLLKVAMKRNPYVPDYLLGRKPIPKERPADLGLGDDNEAVDYAQNHVELWRQMELMRELNALTGGK